MLFFVKKIQLGGHRYKNKLVRGYALINNKDFKKVSHIFWVLSSHGYASGFDKKTGKKVYMHRLILNPPKNKQTDHINGNRLDNRRENLRIATRSQNGANKSKYPIRKTTSKYKGVYFNKLDKKWVAKVKINKKEITFGQYRTEHQAAIVYDLWAVDLFGKYARPNNKVVLFGRRP